MAIKGYNAFPSIAGASPSDCLVSYAAHTLWESYPSAEMQSVYSTVPVDWATPVRVPSMGQIDLFIIFFLYLIRQFAQRKKKPS